MTFIEIMFLVKEEKSPSFLYFISIWKKKNEAVGFNIYPVAVVSHLCDSRDFNWKKA